MAIHPQRISLTQLCVLNNWGVKSKGIWTFDSALKSVRNLVRSGNPTGPHPVGGTALRNRCRCAA